MAVITKGITLAYKKGETNKVLTNLQEIPDMGGDTDAIEVTTLADGAHTYTDGIKNYGDNLPFKFLYEKEQYTELNTLTGSVEWVLTLPDGEAFTWSGSCSVKLAGAGVSAALTYTLSIKPTTEIVFA